jgi:hypothetical protein
MLAMTAKAGFGFAVTFSIIFVTLETVQSESLADALLVFVAAGIVPGTDIKLSAELTLVIVAFSLMFITAYLYRRYAVYRAAVNAVTPEFVHQNSGEAPDKSKPVTFMERLYRVVGATRMAVSRIRQAAVAARPALARFARRMASAARSAARIAVILSVKLYQWLGFAARSAVDTSSKLNNRLIDFMIGLDRRLSGIDYRKNLNDIRIAVRKHVMQVLKTVDKFGLAVGKAAARGTEFFSARTQKVRNYVIRHMLR